MPFSWILILIPVLLVYFFGWTVLMDVVLAGLLITLGTYLYNHFASSGKEWQTLDFLFDSKTELMDPGELLEAVRGRLRVRAFEDLIVEAPRPAAIQRICAVSEAGEA